MKLRKILVIALALVLLTGCGTKYEDTNGADDYTLQSITDDMLFGSISSTASGTVKSELFGVYKESCDEFNGVGNIVDLSELTYSSSWAQITISFHITSGNGRLFICDLEHVIAEVEINKDNQVITFDASGFAYLRLAGESLAYEIEYMVAY